MRSRHRGSERLLEPGHSGGCIKKSQSHSGARSGIVVTFSAPCCGLAAELRGIHQERAVEQSAGLEIGELGPRSIARSKMCVPSRRA